MAEPLSIKTEGTKPTADKNKPEPSLPECSGLQCIIAVPARFLENLFNSTLALPRAAQEMQKDVINMTSTASQNLRGTVRETGETTAAFVNGMQQVTQQSNVVLKDVSDGLKKGKTAIADFNTAIKDTTEALSTTVETTGKVFSALAKAGQFMDNVAETGKKVGETAAKTAAFFKYVTPRDKTEPTPPIDKDVIIAKTDK